MKKITKATLKSFVKKNRPQLFVNVTSKFDGMTDGCESQNGGFQKAQERGMIENTLGVAGIWLVGSSGNYFKAYEDNHFQGVEVSNCCGRFVVAIKKAA